MGLVSRLLPSHRRAPYPRVSLGMLMLMLLLNTVLAIHGVLPTFEQRHAACPDFNLLDA